MRINWFSPLPPSHTEIAQSTWRLLPALCAAAEVTLWTDQEHWHSELERYAKVRRFDPANIDWAALNNVDATFYNIGNNSKFHSAIWRVCREHPGFAIMHDVFMHDSVAHDCKVRNDRAAYLSLMQSIYGALGRRDAEWHWDGILALDQMSRVYSCIPYILQSSLGAIVHSRMAQHALLRELQLPVARAPLPFPAKNLPAPHSSEPPWQLVAFGYFGANRCLDQLLTALSYLDNRRLFRLHIYGELNENADPVARLIQTLHLEGSVVIHGFVPEARLEAALSAAHIAVNLRYPTKGEASASQLRIWSHGLPSLVTRIGWYAELPSDTVAFVRPDFMVEDICTYLREYASAPERFVELGMNGYRYLATRHSPQQYAAKIVEVAANAMAHRRSLSALQFTTRAAQERQAWLETGALPDYDSRLASVIQDVSGGD
jgi:glycosyltransferase involved in cell wall biosynthesis